jgi:hypothetical protein
MRVGLEAREFETPLLLREEQPTSSLLSSIAPELPALCAPVEVRRAMTIEGVTGAEAILTFTDGTPFVAVQSPSSREPELSNDADVSTATTKESERRTSSERGLVVCVASSPELSWTNLPVKPLMVPLFQEIVRTGVELASTSDEVAVGDRLRVARKGVFRLTDVTRETAAIEVGDDGVSNVIVPLTGVWKGDEGLLIAANVRPASLALTPNAREAVRAAFLPLGGVQIADASVSGANAESPELQGTSDDAATARSSSWENFWSFVLLIAALVFLLTEGVLSRVFSHASLAQTSGRDGAIKTVGRVRSRMTTAARLDREPSSPRVGTGGAS